MPQLIKPPVPLFKMLYLVDVDILGLAQITDWATGESGFYIRRGASCSLRQSVKTDSGSKATSYENGTGNSFFWGRNLEHVE